MGADEEKFKGKSPSRHFEFYFYYLICQCFSTNFWNRKLNCRRYFYNHDVCIHDSGSNRCSVQTSVPAINRIDVDGGRRDFVANVSPLLALPVNIAMLFLILYTYTFEYVSHLYFPYILSYLFLVFISPVPPEHLPKRLLGMFIGAVGIILYQLVNGRKRLVKTAHDVLTTMIDEADSCIDSLLSGRKIPQRPEELRSNLCKLSKIVYDRRKRALCISDASFAMIDSGRGLENLILLLYDIEGPVTPEQEELLRSISQHLSVFRSFMHRKENYIPAVERAQFDGDPESACFYQCLLYIREHMLKMTYPEERKSYPKTKLSFLVRLKAALHLSPVRLVYALRVSCLLAFCTLAVQQLNLSHGKWLLFTVASVSLPYADDVGRKAKKRLIATLVGGVCSVILYSLIPSATGRTIVMMLSGYLSFYFSDYSATFACSTIGALGGAVFMGKFGWGPVGEMLLIRLGYIGLGILVALAVNKWLFPFKRKTATCQLWKKYVSTTELLSKVCQQQELDPQLYYSLVIQAHLQEEKIAQNAKELNWDGAKALLEQCRETVRNAHRMRPVYQNESLQPI